MNSQESIFPLLTLCNFNEPYQRKFVQEFKRRVIGGDNKGNNGVINLLHEHGIRGQHQAVNAHRSNVCVTHLSSIHGENLWQRICLVCVDRLIYE